METRCRYSEVITSLDLSSPLSTHLSTKTPALSESRQGPDPFIRVPCEKSVDSLFDDMTVYTHGGSHDRQVATHVLDQLVPALPTLEWPIEEWHNTNVAGREKLDLRFLRPGGQLELDSSNGRIPRAYGPKDDFPTVGHLCKGFFQQSQEVTCGG